MTITSSGDDLGHMTGDGVWIRATARLADACGLALMIFILATILLGEMPLPVQRGVVLLLGSAAILLSQPSLPPSWRRTTGGTIIDRLLTIAFIATIAWAMIYIFIDWYDMFSYRMGFPLPEDLMVFAATLIVTLEITRRSCGLGMALLVVGFMAFIWAGPWLPGVLHHSTVRFEVALEEMFGQGGILGSSLGLMASMIYIFVLYGAVLRASGAGEAIIRLAGRGTRRVPGGPAQSAIVASMGFGSLSGSGPANVLATGSFTIPFMIRVGYRPSFAGAVEACASTIGQITPPVMGIVAFLMADITGIPYVTIVIASIIPCLLFYGSISIRVMLAAKAEGLSQADARAAAELPPVTRANVIEGLTVLASATAIVVMLAQGYSPAYACLAGIGVLLGGGIWHRPMRMGPQKIVQVLIEAARDGLSLLAMCAAVGIILAVVNMTGIGLAFSKLVLAVGGDSLFLALLATMVASLVLGTGLPTTPAYLLLAFTVVPALVQLGLPVITAHLFIFYFGIMSAITPPVALSAFSASSIARTHPMTQAFAAVRMGATGFIIPFLMVYHPGVLIVDQGLAQIVSSTIACAVAVTALAAADQGWLVRRLNPGWRILLGLAAFGLILPGITSTVAGIAVLVATVAAQLVLARREQSPAVATAD
ncbi:TRAP transporter fused permease subunit [Tistrella bauzanensis]|uniref:TRAP transporter fused permease subunit n=1 Tax=Tistrella arctica TaxID=3133430 RepID=A0ABU9YK61_9PROT